MVKMQDIEMQLKRIGASFRFWGWAEVRELQHILMPGEEIRACISGRYEGGFAVLCATDVRVLLIDKKILYLTLEDIRYDMIVEVDYNYRLMNSTISVITPTKTLVFTSYKKYELRQAFVFVQQRVTDVRQHQFNVTPQFSQAVLAGEQQPETQPIVSMSNDLGRPFIPQAPHRKIVNPYTQSPLSTRRRVSRFY